MPSIDSMSKQEFADYALTQNITLNVSMTKAEMIADYQKSLGVAEETPAPVVEETPAPVVEETPAPVVEETPAPVVDETVLTEEEASIVEEAVTEVEAAPAEPTAEEIAIAEANVAKLIADAEAVKAEEERIANLPEEEQIEMVQWTVEEAIGILRYALARGKNKKPFEQSDKIYLLINQIEESVKY